MTIEGRRSQTLVIPDKPRSDADPGSIIGIDNAL
jgi:hypothetical protein